MRNEQYLTRMMEDIRTRATKVLVNDAVELPISSTELIGTSLKVWTKGMAGVSLVTNIKLLDEKLGVISERDLNLEVYDAQFISFSFEYDVERKVVIK